MEAVELVPPCEGCWACEDLDYDYFSDQRMCADCGENPALAWESFCEDCEVNEDNELESATG